MPTFVSAFKNKFILAPEGTWQAVCVDVIALGKKRTKYYPEPTEMVELRWQLSARMDDGRPYLANRTYNMTLGEGSSLLKDLESWRGKPFTASELAKFDLDTCIGANCILTIVHKEGEKGSFANVWKIEPLKDPKVPKLHPMDYVRTPKVVQETDPEPPPTQGEDEVPF